MMFAAEASGHSRQLEKFQKSSGKEHVALVEVSRCCTEDEVRARLAKYGVAWCNSVDSGRYLVRFLSHEGLLSAMKTLHGSSWLGDTFSISPYAVGQGQLLSGGVQHDSSFTPRADSIPAMQASEQLDYFSAVLQDEQQLQQRLQQQEQQQEHEEEEREVHQHSSAQAPPTSSSAFHSQSMQDLEPCDAEWNPPALGDSSLIAPLEEQGSFNADASPLQSFSSGTSTCQLWSQRSIGAVARKDLAKFAAMQHMALQHSCNSPTQASLLAAGHHVMGLGSPWGSAHSSGSLASLALTAAGNTTGAGNLFQDSARRTSSPNGQLSGHHSLGTPAACGTPSSPHHHIFNNAGNGNAEGPYALTLQQQEHQLQAGHSGSTGSGSRGSGWPSQSPNLTVNLPSELGLGDSSALADEEVRRLNSMATARQQQQAGPLGPPSIRTGHNHYNASVSSSLPNFAGMLSSYGSDSAGSPLAGPPGSQLASENSGSLLAAAAGAASSRFATPRSFNGNLTPGDPPGFPASPHHLGHIPPPPPPPMPQQGGAGSAAGPPGTPGTPPGSLLGQPPPPPPPGGSRTPPAQGPLLESYSSNGYDGTPRAAGVISPVQPAPPPPRSVTPGAAGGWQGAAGSGGCSPRVGGMSQPQSPSSGYRVPPRPAGMRGYQHNMSNLGISCQHSSGYDGYGPGPQQTSAYHRGSSPMGHRAHSPSCSIPPPPPPSTHVPPGYVAAANAAVSACGAQISPVPSPPPPAGGFGARSGSSCGPLAAAASGPVGSALPASAVSTPTGRAAGAGGLLPHASAPVPSALAGSHNDSSSSSSTKDAGTASQDINTSSKPRSDLGMGAATSNGANSSTDAQRLQQQQQLKADGVLFVEELLQLLKQPGATAGNMFLANLTDLLECALGASSVSATTTPPNKGSPNNSLGSLVGPSSHRTSSDEQRAAAAAAAAAVIAANGSSRVPLLATATLAESVAKAALSSSSSTPRTFRSRKDTTAGDRTARQVPVDAAAFLGMLQEAAAPLLAAAATAAAAAASSHRGLYGNMSNGGRRPGQQRSSEGPENSSGGSRNQSMGGDSRGSRGGQRGSMVGVGNTQGGGCEGLPEGSLGYSGGSNDLSSLPLNLLLRHSLAGASKGGAGTPLLLPLHPRTTTHSSCGGSAPGTPHGTPMLLVPQTVPELLATRAALIRLLMSAHAFIQGPVYARMASRLAGIEELYDSMHEDPVVVKRRKCRDMAAMRDVIKRDTSFAQAVSSVSSMRNHIYSLSRKVLIGFGLMESLPIDLLLGGLTSELAAILAEACDAAQLGQQQQQQQHNGSASHSSAGGSGATPRASAGNASSALGTPRASNSSASSISSGSRSSGGGSNTAPGLAAAATAPTADTGSIVLPQHIVEFFTAALPVPKLALLVFVEFVPVEPAPCSTALPPSGLGASEGWDAGSSSNGGAGGGGSRMAQQQASKDRRRSSASSTDQVAGNDSSSGGPQQPGSAAATPRSRGGHHGRWGHNKDRDNGRLRESGGGSGGGTGSGSMPNTPRRGSRGNGYSSAGNAAGGGNESKRSSNRRSGHGGYDLVAEAAALEAAATAAAPLVAAAVCDLPTGNRRQGSNAGSSS